MKKTENTSLIKNSPQDNLRSIAIIVCAIITGVSGFFSFYLEGSIFPFTFQNLFCLMFAGIIGGISGAAVSGITLLLGALEKTHFKKIIFSMLVGFAIIYLVGIFQYFKVTKIGFSFLTIENLLYRTIPLFIGDLIKLIIASTATYFLRPLSAKYFYEQIRNN